MESKQPKPSCTRPTWLQPNRTQGKSSILCVHHFHTFVKNVQEHPQHDQCMVVQDTTSHEVIFLNTLTTTSMLPHFVYMSRMLLLQKHQTHSDLYDLVMSMVALFKCQQIFTHIRSLIGLATHLPPLQQFQCHMWLPKFDMSWYGGIP